MSADKPSAIFRINNSSIAQSTMDMDEMTDEDRVEEFNINVGISIVPLAAAQAELAALKAQPGALVTQQSVNGSSAPSNPNDIAVLANRIVQHAYNFLSGFTGPDGKVPIKALDEWWNKFKARLAANPKFLESLDG